jgi:hypothetical protein
MARFKDILPSQQSWIHDLAKAELNPDAERLLQMGRSSNSEQLIEESAVDFLTELRDHIQDHARAFNAFAENGQKFQEIKIYNTAQTAADFMLFRNQIKLLVSNPGPGMIQLSFVQHGRGALSVDGVQQASPSSDSAQTQDLIATVGPFRDIHWTFLGEKVTAEQVAKFYFTEFVRVTRDKSRARGNNQQLLEQIRTLLHEKGLEL